MDVFYNEFSTPKFLVKYNPQLPQLLSLAEVDGGITSFSLYDSKYSNENVTPFFRAKILDTTFSNKQVVCILEWVSYFIAAPTMFFGKEYFSIIPKEILLKVPNSQIITIKEQEVIAIKLFDLYDNPNRHRELQKKYWKVTSLSQRIKEYQEKACSVDAIIQYKIRYNKMKALRLKKKNNSCF